MISVVELRNNLDMTQEEFAEVYKIPLCNVSAWERGFRAPSAAALTLLEMIQADPVGVIRILEMVQRNERAVRSERRVRAISGGVSNIL